MKEEYTETSKSKLNKNNNYIKNNINNKYGKISNIIMNYLYLVLIIILIIIIIVFLFLYLSKMKKIGTNKNKNEKICAFGLFLHEDDKTKCIKCSIENCNDCIGTKLNNTCNKCKPGFNPIYEDNKIILCSICKEGNYLINGKCKEYSFRAKYKSNGGIIKLINSDLSKIKEMFVDGKQVSPSNSYLFSDTQDHEVFMLLDMTKFLNSINSIFYGIDRMISISFSSFFNTSNINEMNYMFYNCSLLESITLSKFNTSIVNNMNSMFYNCFSLKSIYLSNFVTSNVDNMQLMFSGCSSLTSINLSNFNTSKVSKMDSMFSRCSSLASINLSNLDTSKVTNMDYMFDGCYSLTSINFSNFVNSKVTSIQNMFSGCSSLKSINLSKFDTSSVTVMNSTFYNCSSLTSINLSTFDTSKVIFMDYMFYNCSSLTSIDLSNFETSKVINMTFMFSGCSQLSFIDISKFSSSSMNIQLFDKYIPSFGTIITKFNFRKNLNMSYISEWDKIINNLI